MYANLSIKTESLKVDRQTLPGALSPYFVVDNEQNSCQEVYNS